MGRRWGQNTTVYYKEAQRHYSLSQQNSNFTPLFGLLIDTCSAASASGSRRAARAAGRALNEALYVICMNVHDTEQEIATKLLVTSWLRNSAQRSSFTLFLRSMS